MRYIYFVIYLCKQDTNDLVAKLLISMYSIVFFLISLESRLVQPDRNVVQIISFI